MNNKRSKVLLTGASGYIALHTIGELIKSGFDVRGSLRNLSKEKDIRNSIHIPYSEERLEFCELNLLNDYGWEEALSGCEYIIHMASPFIIEEPKNENDLIEPALAGTMRALKAAKKSKIKKFVLTSSMAAIAYGHNKTKCNQNDWSDLTKDIGAYIKSKTLAEKAAWNFVKDNSEIPFVLTSINPGMVLGPIIGKDTDGASASLVKNMINGNFPAIPDIYFTVVDVRDVAKLHVQSLKNDKSDFKRVIATSSKGISFLNISKILRNLGFNKSPKNLIPSQIVFSMAPFNKDMRTTASMIRRGCYDTENSETKTIFNWEPIQLEDSLKDMTNSLKAYQK